MTRWLTDDDNIGEENTTTTMMLMSIMAFSPRAHLDRMKAEMTMMMMMILMKEILPQE